MPHNTVKNGISSNVKNGDTPGDTVRMGRRPTKLASEFWKRLEDTLGRKTKYQPFNANNLARVLDIKQSVTQQWYAGDAEPELWRVKELAKEAGVCTEWLLNNVKPKYPIHKDAVLRELFDVCEQLNDGWRAHVLKSAQAALASQTQEVNADVRTTTAAGGRASAGS